jgi:G3E family GTPase
MTDGTRVYLITGFLGSGKTTFLNRVLKQFPPAKKLTLLVNEFGEIGVDGTLLEGDDIDMMEISKGSIFCVCVKTDFIKGLYALSTQVQPDVLIIESTGVANPTDLKRDLTLPIFNDRFQFAEQFCIIDAQHFLDAYNAFASVEKQIASSSVFIINKIDVAPTESVEETKNIIKQFHPDPLFFETTYADIPLEPFFDFLKEAPVEPETAAAPRAKMSNLSTAELEEFIDDLLDSPDLEITPPDKLMSVAYQWKGNDLEQIQTLVHQLPFSVVRAKGFLEVSGKTYLLNYVMGDWTIKKLGIPGNRIQHKNIVVLIGPPESMEGIAEAAKTGSWESMGTFQPYYS